MKNVLVGNYPEWRRNFIRVADPTAFHILPMDLDEHTAASPPVDMIVPLKLSEYDLVRSNPIAASRALVPKVGHVMLANYKPLFNQWLVDKGYEACVPRTYHTSAEAVFPLIHKSCIDIDGENSRLIVNRAALALVETGAQNIGMTFLQEAIPGEAEQSTHIIAVEGQIIFKSTVTNHHADPLYIMGRHETPINWTVEYDHAPPEIASIVKKLSYTGAACFDFKIDSHGQMKIFELNPRVGANFWRAEGDFLAAYAYGLRLQNHSSS